MQNLIVLSYFLTSTTGELYILLLGLIMPVACIWATLFLIISWMTWLVFQGRMWIDRASPISITFSAVTLFQFHLGHCREGVWHFCNIEKGPEHSVVWGALPFFHHPISYLLGLIGAFRGLFWGEWLDPFIVVYLMWIYYHPLNISSLDLKGL